MMESLCLAHIHAIGEEPLPLDHPAASFASSKIIIICPRLLHLVIIEVLSLAHFRYLVSQFNGGIENGVTAIQVDHSATSMKMFRYLV